MDTGNLDRGSVEIILQLMEDFNSFYEYLEFIDGYNHGLLLEKRNLKALSNGNDKEYNRLLRKDHRALRAHVYDSKRYSARHIKKMKKQCHVVHEQLCFLRMKFLGELKNKRYNKEARE